MCGKSNNLDSTAAAQAGKADPKTGERTGDKRWMAAQRGVNQIAKFLAVFAAAEGNFDAFKVGLDNHFAGMDSDAILKDGREIETAVEFAKASLEVMGTYGLERMDDEGSIVRLLHALKSGVFSGTDLSGVDEEDEDEDETPGFFSGLFGESPEGFARHYVV